jgi:hypothetical protein
MGPTALPFHLSHVRRVRLVDASDGSKPMTASNVTRMRTSTRGWALVRGDMPAHRRQGCLEDGVRHDADRSRIVPAAEPPTERPDFGLNLLPELLSSATQRRRPSAIDEVFPAVEQEEAGFAWVLAHPLRHAQGGPQTGVLRRGGGEPFEERGLEGGGRLKPHLPQEDIAGGEAVVDGTGRRTHGARDGPDRRSVRAVRGDESARGGEDLGLGEHRRLRHAY